MKVDINEVRRLQERLAEINRLPFDEIEWMDGETPIIVHPEVASEWKFTGLSNEDFVRCEGWLGTVNCEIGMGGAT